MQVLKKKALKILSFMYFPWFKRKINWCHVPHFFQEGTQAQEPKWIGHVPALQAEEPGGQEARRQGSWCIHWPAEEGEGSFYTEVKGHVTLRQLQVYCTCCARPGAGRRGGPGEAHTRRTQGAGGQGVLGLTLVLLLFSRHIMSLRPRRL